MSLPPELLKKVKLLEIQTRKRVNNLFLGEYHSAFKGQGMTFSEFREYVPGDDVRMISWPLYARTEKLYIKKHDEEREMTVILAVDVSGSQDFGCKEFFKGEVHQPVAAKAAEEGGEAPELLAFPLRERVMVTLGAADVDTEEDAGHRTGDLVEGQVMPGFMSFESLDWLLYIFVVVVAAVAVLLWSRRRRRRVCEVQRRLVEDRLRWM